MVIGADSSATFAVGTDRLIEQRTSKKIEIINERVIVAGTGPIGMQQRFVHIVKNLKLTEDKVDHVSAAKLLSRSMIQDMADTHQRPVGFGALVAYPIGKKLYLYEFGEADFQPEMKTSDLWFISMGGGQRITIPLLAFIKGIFWPDGKPPSIQDGILLTVWAIQHAIEVNPGGINGPIKIATLTLNRKGDPHARVLDDTELKEHYDAIKGLTEYIRKWKYSEAAPPPIPDPPG
jgi:20S proteasome alpha/beta subunit